MFYTGYLTYRGRDEERQLRLAIPNREITELFTSQIWQWFRETTREDAGKLEEFCRAFPEGNASVIEEILKGYLSQRTICPGAPCPSTRLLIDFSPIHTINDGAQLCYFF